MRRVAAAQLVRRISVIAKAAWTGTKHDEGGGGGDFGRAAG